MKQFEIIDSHAHIFPQKIAEKASKSIGAFYGLDMWFKGTSEGLLEEGLSAGISRFVVHSSATTLGQVAPINRFIADEIQKHKEFIGYMTLHPDMNEGAIADEMEFCTSNGFKGIKLHPDFQKFNIDDPRAFKIYEAAEGRLPILFHTGDKRYDFSKPERLANVAKQFRGLTVIGAHFGGYERWNEIKCYKGLNNIYVDTSSSLKFIGADEAKKFIDYFGAEWFFFGTDYPMWSAKEEIERFMQINITDAERELIFSGNFKRVILNDNKI